MLAPMINFNEMISFQMIFSHKFGYLMVFSCRRFFFFFFFFYCCCQPLLFPMFLATNWDDANTYFTIKWWECFPNGNYAKWKIEWNIVKAQANGRHFLLLIDKKNKFQLIYQVIVEVCAIGDRAFYFWHYSHTRATTAEKIAIK